MMQEEEIDIGAAEGENIVINDGNRMHDFSIIDSISSNKYDHSRLEIFVAVIITLGTISGGYMEGYSSPAVSSMLTVISPELNESSSTNSTNLPTTTDSSKITTIRLNETNDGDFETTTSSVNFETTMMNPETPTTLRSPIAFEPNVTMSNERELTVTEIPVINLTEHGSNHSMPAEELPTPTPLTSPQFQLTEEQASWFSSLLLLGACAGAFISSYAISLGRKNAILASSIPRIIGWLMITFSSSLFTIYSGRFLCGFSIGFVTSAAPIYISEVSQPKLRGSLSCLVQLGVNIGIFIVVLLGTILSWRLLAFFGAFSVLAYAIPTFFIPKSPAWLVMKGKDNEARAVLCKLRSNPIIVEEEMQEIMKSSENKRRTTSTWSQLLSERRCRVPLYVVLLVTGINRFSGYNALIMYCSTFLHQAAPTLSQYWAAVAVCFVQVLCTGVSLPLVESWGRRKLLISSVLVMGASLITIALYELILKDSDSYTWIAVSAAMTYVGSYSVGIGPLTWVILGEMFPLDAREKASAIVSVTNWLAAFVITKTFFGLEAIVGVAGTCLVYASICVIGVVLMYWFVPETKGCSLAEIEMHFTYSQSTWKPYKKKIDQALSGILDQEVTVDTYSTFQ